MYPVLSRDEGTVGNVDCGTESCIQHVHEVNLNGTVQQSCTCYQYSIEIANYALPLHD